MILLSLFYEFFTISAFSIGGGYAMIPLIKQQIVEAGFLTANQIGDVIAISEMTPGPFAINSATFAGVKTAGILGGIFATLGVVLPSFIYALVVARYYFKYENNKKFENVLKGIRPISVALIASAIASMAFLSINNKFINLNFDIGAIFIMISVFYLSFKKKVSPVLCLIISGIIGIIIYSI